jgi:hypothetical protein
LTYNFDPERWYEIQRAALRARRDRGELDEKAFAAEQTALEQRYEELVARLDGTFEIPSPRRV